MALEEHGKIPGSHEAKRDLPQGRISRPNKGGVFSQKEAPEYTVSENKVFLGGVSSRAGGEGWAWVHSGNSKALSLSTTPPGLLSRKE